LVFRFLVWRTYCELVARIVDGEPADSDVFLVFAELVQIEQDDLVFVVELLSAMDGILAALLVAPVISVRAVLVRHRRIILFDAREQLVVERLLERFGRLHHLRRVGVLGLEMRDDVGRSLVPEPRVVVDQLAPVNHHLFGILLRERGVRISARFDQRMGGCWRRRLGRRVRRRRARGDR
jgi:hypothetical protein